MNINKSQYQRLSIDESELSAEFRTNTINQYRRSFMTVFVISALLFVALVIRIFQLTHPHQLNKTIIFFGDSLITHHSDRVGRLVEENLSQDFENIRILSSGIPGNRIKSLRNRVYRDVLARSAFGLWRMSPPDAVVMYWDSDATEGERPLDSTVIKTYIENLKYVIHQLTMNTKYVVIAGPTLDGEYCRGNNTRDGILDIYAEMNRNVSKEFGAVYIDTRSIFFNHIPSTWKSSRGYLTEDGIHQNIRGSDLLVSVFTDNLMAWLSTNPK